MSKSRIFILLLIIPLTVAILFTLFFSVNTKDKTVATTHEEIIFYPGDGSEGIPLSAEGRISFTEVISDLGKTNEPENLLDPPNAPVACHYTVYSETNGKAIDLTLILYEGERLATIENVPLVGTVTKKITAEAYQKLTHPDSWLEK